jgi:hypothetical protein
MKPPVSPEPRASGRSSQAPKSAAPSLKATLTIALNNVVAGGRASEDDSSDRMLTELFAHVGSQSFEGQAWNPYSDEDSNIEIGSGKTKRVKLEDLLTKALAPLGYRRVDKLTYRADWSTIEVEHTLWFDSYGNPKVYLTGDAGLRNKEAEAFAQQCRQRYGSKIGLRCRRESGKVDPPWFCPMHFSIGRMFDWSIRSSLDTQDLSPGELARAVAEPIRAKLIPYVDGVTTEQRLLDLLESDKEPMDWIRGPYYRAALIAYLARKLGVDRNKTKSVLLPRALYISNGIDKDWLTPESYIDHILDDADAALTAER